MINNFLFIFRYFFLLSINKRIKTFGFVYIQSNVKIIVEYGGVLVIHKNVVLKDGTIIYVKKSASVTIGENTSTGHNSEISANNLIEIGKDVIMGAYTYITDSNHGFKIINTPFRSQDMVIGKVIINNNVWLGRGVMVLKNSIIGNNSVVAAASVVTKAFQDDLLIGGVPAKIIKSIN